MTEDAQAFDRERAAMGIAYRVPDECGIRLERRHVGQLGGVMVDCLLYRNDDGILLGILNYRAGKINGWVHPDHQRKGIGGALLVEAMNRWDDINLEEQDYRFRGKPAFAGVAFVMALKDRGVVT